MSYLKLCIQVCSFCRVWSLEILGYNFPKGFSVFGIFCSFSTLIFAVIKRKNNNKNTSLYSDCPKVFLKNFGEDFFPTGDVKRTNLLTNNHTTRSSGPDELCKNCLKHQWRSSDVFLVDFKQINARIVKMLQNKKVRKEPVCVCFSKSNVLSNHFLYKINIYGKLVTRYLNRMDQKIFVTKKLIHTLSN